MGGAYSKVPFPLPSALPDEIVKEGLPKLNCTVEEFELFMSLPVGKYSPTTVELGAVIEKPFEPETGSAEFCQVPFLLKYNLLLSRSIPTPKISEVLIELPYEVSEPAVLIAPLVNL